MNLSFKIIFCLFLTITTSCSKYDYHPHTDESISISFYMKGVIEDENESRVPFRFYTGENDNVYEKIFWKNSFILDSLPSLITGMYSTSNNIYIYESIDRGIFSGFQFWASSDFPSDEKWSKNELETFFEVGEIFEIGKSANMVDINLRLPIYSEENIDLGNSKSSYVIGGASGNLTITAIEDVEYPSLDADNPDMLRRGKKINCVFKCLIGRFRIAPTGFPNPFYTDEVMDVTNGEAAFFVEY